LHALLSNDWEQCEMITVTFFKIQLIDEQASYGVRNVHNEEVMAEW